MSAATRVRDFVRAAVDERSPPSRSSAIGWAVFYGIYFAWIFWRYPFMPLLVTANVFLHEAGHPIMGIFGRTAMFWGGTIFQLAFPIGGGEHDWEFIFGQLWLLEWDVVIGTATRVAGWLTMLAAPAWMVRTILAAQRPTRGNSGWGSV